MSSAAITYAAAMLGARRHYAVPAALRAAGLLDRFFTDLCAAQGWPRLLVAIPSLLRPACLKRLLQRVPAGLPARQITSFPLFGLRYAARLGHALGPDAALRAYLWGGREFGLRVLRHGLGNAGGVYVFNSAGLEILQAARARGLRTVLDQTIAPKPIELDLLERENRTFPGWEPGPAATPAAREYAQREREEWALADVVICGSDFVKEGIRQCGGPADRCRVVPPGFDLPSRARTRTPRDGPLRVLTVGTVGLRKGSPYVLEAARQLRGRARFRMVGHLAVPEAIAQTLRRHVELIGPAVRSEMPAHFAWADVFLLPSLCEGSSAACGEAMGQALPVVCTPNAGALVRDGVDGYVVPARDGRAIVARVEELIGDPDRRAAMAQAAAARAREFTLEAYARRLAAALP